jgi:thiol-disulfide isomerase/thioredoxin
MQYSLLNKVLNVLLVVIILGYIVNYFYRLPKYESGEMAKEFSATLADGSIFKLSDLKGKYVLLDFWGSWCGPCRKENPSLVALYQETRNKSYKNAGSFEIVSVAIETKEASWRKAIESDGLVWKYQIGEMDRFSSPIATLYGVREIPTKYFISPEGRILMVNPKVGEISSYLKEQEDTY